jgi:hypothetical protein
MPNISLLRTARTVLPRNAAILPYHVPEAMQILLAGPAIFDDLPPLDFADNNAEEPQGH